MSGLRDRARRLPLRTRLVAGFAAAMLVLLTAAGAFVYWRVQYALDRGLDTELRAATRVVAPLVDPGGRVEPRSAAEATGTGWQVVDRDGTVLDTGGPVPTTPLVTRTDLGRAAGAPATYDLGTLLPVTPAPYRVRVTALDPRASAGHASYLVVGVRRDRRDEALRELLLQLALAGLGALAVASLVGDQLARLALRPVERYRRRAEEITGGATGLRLDVPPGREDEVTRLGRTLNEMLGALESALVRERQFVDDASHELRTPLTLLTSRIQLTRRRPRSVAEHERVLDELAVDVGRLATLAEQLLDTSRTPGGSPGVGDLAEAARTVVAGWRTAHPARAADVDLAADEPAPVAVGPVDLQRVVTNLLTNALLHGRAPVRLVVGTEAADAVLVVTDAGPGMDADLLADATRRFARSPEARSRPGSGLGLSLVERLVVAAGGELRLCSAGRHARSGHPRPEVCDHDDRMRVTVRLPRAVPGEPPPVR